MARVFVPGKPFQLNLTFVDKAKSLSFSGAPDSRFNLVSFGLNRKEMKMLSGEKHSSLL
jgi:hypothetical protein